jgi:uncharacterized protein YjaG (DUF416 family)
MTRKMFEFKKFFQESAQHLTKFQLGAFAASCCERQLPIYQKAASGQSWDRFEILRKHLDAVWLWIQQQGKSQIAENAPLECERSAPPEPFDGGTTAATDVAFSVSALMSFIKSNDLDCLMGISETSYNLIDALIYAVSGLEINSDNDAVIDRHELMQMELTRQYSDLSDLLQTEDLLKTGAELRTRAVESCLAGNVWFPDDY